VLLNRREWNPEIPLAVLPLPPPLPRRYRRGGGGAVAVGFFK
jgi:hypothetical protein